MTATDIWDLVPRTAVFENVDPIKFRTEIMPRQRPAILRGVLDHWEITQAARTSDRALRDYLVGHANGSPIEANCGPPEIRGFFNYRPDFTGVNYERKAFDLGAFFDLLLTHKDDPAPPALQGGSLNIVKHLPQLVSALPLPFIAPEFDRLISVWIGNRARTAAHWDLPENLICPVAGRRRCTLMPLRQAKNLYIGPLDVTLAGRPTSIVDFHEPDFARFPRFAEAMGDAEIADIGPGDALYLPSVWIHHVETLDSIGVMVNFWWREAPDFMLSPYMTMLHSLLTLRDLPEHERMAWRELFDLYVFGTEGPAMDHIPPAARGLWGELNDEKVRRLKAYLTRTLSH